MKLTRFVAGWMATMMIVSLTACGGEKNKPTPAPTTNAPIQTNVPAQPTAVVTDVPTNAPTDAPTDEPDNTPVETFTEAPTDTPVTNPPAPADNPDKSAYYDGYLRSPDFGTVSTDGAISTVTTDGMTMTMFIAPKFIEWTLDTDKVGMYVADDTLWVMVSIKDESGAQAESWCKAPIPAGTDPLADYREDAAVVEGDDFRSCSYVETVTINGVEFDKVLLVPEEVDPDELYESAPYTAYITTDTHKIAKMESVNTDMTGTVTTVELDFATVINNAFTTPATADEVTYEQAEMTFSFGLLAMMFKTMPADMWDDIGD